MSSLSTLMVEELGRWVFDTQIPLPYETKQNSLKNLNWKYIMLKIIGLL